MKLENEEDKEFDKPSKKILTKNSKIVTSRKQTESLEEWEKRLMSHFADKTEKQRVYEEKMKKELGINEFSTVENSQINSDYIHVAPTMLLPMYCQFDTREKCDEYRKSLACQDLDSDMSLLTFKLLHGKDQRCNKIHFKPTVSASTMPSLGDCSYLDTCKGKGQCKYVHYDTQAPQSLVKNLALEPKNFKGAEWINCDVLK